jgi:thioredoxin reductase
MSNRLEDPPSHVQKLPIPALSQRTADAPVIPPDTLPATTPALEQYRFVDSSIYPDLETNIHAESMQFSREPIPVVRSQVSIQRHGENTPFRPYKVIKNWVGDMLARDNYSSMISYNTTVELASKDESTGTWTLTLRKPIEGKNEDYWWSESFDAVVVATGHYIVPFIPSIPGLTEFAESNPGVVIHSKQFRDRESYCGKRIVTVGASISATDLAFCLADVAAPPLYAVVRGKYHPYFGDWAFQHPNIVRKPTISRFESEGGKRTIVFDDGTKLENVDAVIFGTGYSWTLPFLPQVEIRNNRVTGFYQHIFWQKDPSLCLVGAVSSYFTIFTIHWIILIAHGECRWEQALPLKSLNTKLFSVRAILPAATLSLRSQHKANGKRTGLRIKATAWHSRSSLRISKNISTNCEI